MTKTQIWRLAIGGAVVAAAGAVAFFALAPKVGAGHCSGQECQIHIDVVDCAKGVIEATPDPAKIDRAKNIKWTIDTAGYMFTTNGIQISGSDFTPDPGLIPSEGGNKWRIRDAYLNRGETKYTIEVKPSTGANCAPKDPFIVNE